MLQPRPRETLDHGDHGWLKARYHFVVSADGNRVNRPLGALVVWNDDEIAPGTGFGRHSHAGTAANSPKRIAPDA
jgi:quercetin 2,3-dioxygenase